MKNFSHKFKIIAVNFLLLLFVWIICDFCYFAYSLYQENQLSLQQLKGFYRQYNNEAEYIDYLFLEADNDKSPHHRTLRMPAGLKYNSYPFVIFGCSFAYGQYLNDKQSFYYKLSEAIKHPVYNRAMVGTGLQQMYYQTTTDYFYKQVPPCNTVIYVFIDDHFRRMLGESFVISDGDIPLHYNDINHNLIADNKNNLLSFYKKDYIFIFIKRLFNQYRLKHDSDKISDEALDYFVNMRKNLEKHWQKKINFIIIFYETDDSIRHHNNRKLLISKLKSNNFETIELSEISDISLTNKEYIINDGHPNEKAWDIITPLFIEECKKRNLIEEK